MQRRLWIGARLIPFVLAICVDAQSPAVGGADSQVLADLLQRTGEEVRRFEEAFTLVISEENYRQYGDGQTLIGFKERRTHAEMLFLWLPEEQAWLTARNVLAVDGHPVADNGRLDEALKASGPDRLARLQAVIDDNARFNVGRTKRNFNYPTLVLSFLDPDIQRHFAFSLVGRERVNGVNVWKINYQERGSPTVIRGDGGDLKSRGSVWLAADGGAVVRTLLELTISNPRTAAWANVTVDYRHDPKLTMWVPTAMRETYMEMLGSRVYEHVGGDATYSNFRRFETGGRMVTPP